MTEITTELLVDCRNHLGEGVQWDVESQRLFWTDIQECKLYSVDEDGANLEIRDLPERLCSFTFDADDNVLAAMASGLFRLNLVDARCERLTDFEPDVPTTRMNDGRCDRQGRFIVGGVDETGLKGTSSVVRYDPDGRTVPMIDDVGCANSLAFSLDGRQMYFADTSRRTIWRYAYDPATGDLGEALEFAVLGNDEGSPDGSCVDAEDALWNAQFRGACVQRFHADGSRGTRVTVPVPNVTCACFGGRNLDRLYITTAREKMSEADIAAAPQSGSLFVADVGVSGVPEVRFGAALF